MAWNLIVLEKWQQDFIRDNFFKLTNPQIAKAIGLNLTTTRKHCYRMGLKRMEMEYWCAVSVRFLRLYYRKIGDTELAEIFTKHFPKEKKWTKKHIDKKRRYLFLLRTDEEIAAIKQRNTDLGRFAICVVKRWQSTGSANIGDIHIWKNHNDVNIAFIKTDKGFIPRNRWLWIQNHGELAVDDIIRAKPDAPVIAELNHLEKITRTENAFLNKQLPRSIIKTLFKIKDNVLAQQIADDFPELIEQKRQTILLNQKINKEHAK